MLVFSLIGMYLGLVLFRVPINDMVVTDPDIMYPRQVEALKFMQFVAATGTFIIAPFLSLKYFRLRPRPFLGLNQNVSSQYLLLATLLFASMFPFLEWLIGFNSKMQLPESWHGIENWMKLREEQLTGLTLKFLEVKSPFALLWNIVVIAIVPAIGEELFFRGIVQNILARWTGKNLVAVLITAFVFSAIHLQFYGFLPRFLLGIILGYLFIWSGSLWVSIYFHFLNNVLAVIFSYLSQINVIDYQIDQNMNSSNFVVALSFFIMAVIFLSMAVYYERKRKKQDDWKKVFSSDNLNEIQIYQGMLKNQGIESVIMNKKDSSIQSFGQIELYVQPENAEKAREIIIQDQEEKTGQTPEE